MSKKNVPAVSVDAIAAVEADKTRNYNEYTLEYIGPTGERLAQDRARILHLVAEKGRITCKKVCEELKTVTSVNGGPFDLSYLRTRLNNVESDLSKQALFKNVQILPYTQKGDLMPLTLGKKGTLHYPALTPETTLVFVRRDTKEPIGSRTQALAARKAAKVAAEKAEKDAQAPVEAPVEAPQGEIDALSDTDSGAES